MRPLNNPYSTDNTKQCDLLGDVGLRLRSLAIALALALATFNLRCRWHDVSYRTTPRYVN